MRFKTVTAMTLVFILTLGLAGIACAADNLAILEQGNWVNLAKELELNDQQLNKMRSLQVEFHQKMQEQRNQLQQTMFELRQMQFDREPDMAKVQQKIQEANTLRAKMREQAAQHREQMRSVLTPEQQQKWNRLCPQPRGFGSPHR